MVVERIKLSGMEELKKVFQQLPKRMQERDLLFALRKGANLMRGEAKKNVPVDQSFLRDSIKVRKVKSPQGVAALTVTPVKPKGFHAHFVEFGTVNKAPQPFMRPAFDQHKVEATAVVVQALGKRVDKTAQNLAKKYSKSGLVKRKRKRRK